MLERRTRMVSSPKHSILCHGMMISSSFPIPKIPSLPDITSARILASSLSNSKSEAHPKRVPSQRLMISNLLKSAVLHRFISLFLSSKASIRHCMQKEVFTWLSAPKKRIKNVKADTKAAKSARKVPIADSTRQCPLRWRHL